MTEPGNLVAMDQLLCSVVVTTWRRPEPLRATLDSLLRQSYAALEIVVVCDGPDTETAAVAEAFAGELRIRWITHEVNRGLPAARNTGAAHARGEIVLFLDDDVLADADLVAMHVQHHTSVSALRRVAVHSLARNRSAVVLQNPLEQFLNEVWDANLHATSALLQQTGPDAISDDVQRQLCFGLNCSMRRELFQQMGGFDEDLRASDEEVEFGMRLHLAGVEIVFEPRVLLEHINTTRLAEYYPKCWRASGAADVHRAMRLGQRNAQTQLIMSAVHAPWMSRTVAHMNWRYAKPLLNLASKLKAKANTTGKRSYCGAWARIKRPAEYWNAVQQAGCTLKHLRGADEQERVALMLHSISNPLSAEEASYYIAPERFGRLMRKFKSAGYKTATLAQWLEDQLPSKHVLMTFDDAYDDLYENLLPLVIKHGYTPLIFVVADHVGDENRWDQTTGLRARKLMTAAQLREMQKYGVEFGSHTLTHPWLPDVSDEQLYREVIDSKKKLEDLFGVEMASFAYPYGGVDRRVRSAVAAAGYTVAFTTQPGANWWNDPLCQRRAEVNQHTSAGEFMSLLKRGERWRSSFSRELRALEAQLPTQALRRLAGSFRSMLKSGSRSLDVLSGRSRD